VIKVTTNAYVFKFVGGDKTARCCHYCKKLKLGGMICVYGNGPEDNDDTIYVCPKCAERGCRDSEVAWSKIARRSCRK
jgi:hypothetical protein